MMSFKEYFEKEQVGKEDKQVINIVEIPNSQNSLLEYQTYKPILGTKQSYREDNTNAKTQQHVDVYAQLKGKGKELYSVNIDVTGHDGNHGKKIPSKYADFLRGKGYAIRANNIIENEGLFIEKIFILLD